jgi:hypothetical protein
LEASTHVRVVLKPHHKARTHQLVEDRIAFPMIEPAHLSGLPCADLIAWRHGKQEILQPVDAVVHKQSAHVLDAPSQQKNTGRLRK